MDWTRKTIVYKELFASEERVIKKGIITRGAPHHQPNGQNAIANLWFGWKRLISEPN